MTRSLCLGQGTTLAAPSGQEHTCSAPPFQQTAPTESPGTHSLTGLPCLHRDCQESEGTPVACAFPRPSFLMAAPLSLSKRGASGPRPRPQLIGHELLKGKRGLPGHSLTGSSTLCVSVFLKGTDPKIGLSQPSSPTAPWSGPTFTPSHWPPAPQQEAETGREVGVQGLPFPRGGGSTLVPAYEPGTLRFWLSVTCRLKQLSAAQGSLHHSHQTRMNRDVPGSWEAPKTGLRL